jgi:hypothetical protein
VPYYAMVSIETSSALGKKKAVPKP